MKVVRLDHLVLTVRGIDRTVAFYSKVMGMRRQDFGDGRVALRFGDQKINLHLLESTIAPKAAHPMPGSADLCFLIEAPLAEAMERVRGLGIAIVEGPVERTGATGPIRSFYFRDPDGNLIEIANRIYY